MDSKTNVVLVHGVWADGSCWNKVLPLLQHEGLDVVAPINALLLAERPPNAQLIVYPDSSRGAQYQYAGLFLKHVKLFLTGRTT